MKMEMDVRKLIAGGQWRGLRVLLAAFLRNTLVFERLRSGDDCPMIPLGRWGYIRPGIASSRQPLRIDHE
jgi:hypothetical protein